MTKVEPVFIESGYINDVALWRVTDRGWLGSQFIDVPELSTETVLSLEVNLKDLAWVAFYKRALIKIKHLKPTEIKSELLEGERQKWAEHQFVIDVVNGLPVFDTETAILERGELSPHMSGWLNRLAHNPLNSSSVELAFEDLLGRGSR